MRANVTRLSRTSARTLAIVGLVAGMLLIPSATKLAPSAQAAGYPCWRHNIEDAIKTGFVTNVNYGAQFYFCATNGIVDSFVVESTYAVAGTAARNAKIDIQPYRPLEWGPTYKIYIKVTADKTITGGGVDLKGVQGTAQPTQYQDYWDVTLTGSTGAAEGKKLQGR